MSARGWTPPAGRGILNAPKGVLAAVVRVIACIAGVVAILIAFSTSGTATTLWPRPAFVGAHAFTPKHLLVADSALGAIAGFPLVRGEPQQFANEEVTGVTDPHIAVDGAGNVYGGYTYPSGNSVIFKFSPSLQLIGQLQLGFPDGGLAVDSTGNLYVLVGYQGATVLEFPNFSPSGGATLTGSGMTSIFFGPRQRLYATTFEGGIDVFDHPTVSSTPSTTIAQPPRQLFTSDVATWDERGRLIATYYPQYLRSDFDDNDFDVISWTRTGRHDNLIHTKDCWSIPSEGTGPNNPGFPLGIASYRGFISEACASDASTRVWVYRSDRFGRQQPVDVLRGLVQPGAVALGR